MLKMDKRSLNMSLKLLENEIKEVLQGGLSTVTK